MPRNATKALRDLAVLVAATAAWWLSEHVTDLGLPEEAAPLVGALALAGYRVLRDKSQGPADRPTL